MRYHFTLVRTAIIRKSKNNKCWRDVQGLWQCKLVELLWRPVWRLLKKLKIEVPYYSAIPLLGVYLEENIIQKYRSNLNVHPEKNG